MGRRDARTLARDLLGMTQEAFSRAFQGSPMKRATQRATSAGRSATPPWHSVTWAHRDLPPLGAVTPGTSRL